MATAIKNIILDDLVTRLDAITDDSGNDLFQYVERGHPATVADNQLPAAWVVGLDERPVSGQHEEMAINDLPVGFVLQGKQTRFGDIDTELVDLEVRVRKSLEGYQPSGGGKFEMTYRSTISPMSNQNIPVGRVMIVMLVRYYHLRGDPFALS